MYHCVVCDKVSLLGLWFCQCLELCLFFDINCFVGFSVLWRYDELLVVQTVKSFGKGDFRMEKCDNVCVDKLWNCNNVEAHVSKLISMLF